MVLFANTKKRAARRAWPIHGYVGPNGGGKSCAMVWDTMPTLASGRRVLSTVRLLDFEDPRPCEGFEYDQHGRKVGCVHPEHAGVLLHVRGSGEDNEVTGTHRLSLAEGGGTITHRQAHPLYTRLTDWPQLMEAEHCDVLLDEVTGIASSRESAGLPAAVANKLVQLRRADVVVRWSAPAWARADKIIRECSQAVTYCTGSWSKVIESDDGTERLWAQKRLFRWRTFDATLFEDFTAGKREDLSSESSQWAIGSRTGAFEAYDTYDAVSVVGTVSDAGRCYQCGGRRSAEPCSCPDYLARKADRTTDGRERGPRVRGGGRTAAGRTDAGQEGGHATAPHSDPFAWEEVNT